MVTAAGKVDKKKRKKEKVRITGVAGFGRGVGVTHVSILMANYLCSACGKKTAVLEWNSHGDWSRIGKMCTGQIGNRKRYRIQGADFYPSADAELLAECAERGYEEVLIDFGTIYETEAADLLRCHKMFLVVSFSEWQMEASGEFLRSEDYAGKESWQFLAAFGSEESRTEWNRKQKPKVLRIPFSADAFTITRELMKWMETLLK